MVNCIFIRNEDIGKKDYTRDALYAELNELISSGQIEYASLIARYTFPSYDHFSAFLTGAEAAGISEEYSYVWEDTKSPKYDEQHEDYSRFDKLLKEYLD